MENVLNYLERDHARCAGLLDALFGFVRDTDWSVAAAANAQLSRALLRHLRIEEELIFRPLDAVIDSVLVPTANMRAEHQRIRGISVQLASAIDQNDAAQAFKCARMLQIVLQLHFDKEHSGFFFLADKVLAPQHARLAVALAAFDQDDGQQRACCALPG